MTEHRYTDAERAAIYKVIEERRDMRHFLGGEVDPATLQRIFRAAHFAPSVGFMQPWRFIRILKTQQRAALAALVEQERLATADALGERRDEFMALKVEGIRDCAELLAVVMMPGREQHVFGRRTMPHMDLASTACAIQNLWLAARAEGLGLGWVSLFEPVTTNAQLQLPEGAETVALLCLGPVADFYQEPMLAQENWAQREDLAQLIMDDVWQD